MSEGPQNTSPQNNGLSLDGVKAGYGETIVLEGISLDLAPGGTLAVLGRNGVGKTTLLATIMGHTALHAGHVRFAGSDVSALPAYRRARLGIGFVPQEREIFPSLTVEENLAVAERPGPWSLGRVYELFPALASRRRNRGNKRINPSCARFPSAFFEAVRTSRSTEST